MGRIRSRTDWNQPDHSASYTYDSLYRPRDVAGSTWGIHWDFDNYGNRTVQNPTGQAANMIAPQTMGGHVNNRMPISCPGLPGHNCYDQTGNLFNDASTPTPHNYAYDAEGRITNTADVSSLLGLSAGGGALSRAGININRNAWDNPRGASGTAHNVVQTFQWSEPNPCR